MLEVRAVWLTTAAGLDWPKSTNKEEQQRSLLAIVHSLKSANLNTIFFQARARGDAYYRSSYEPWAENLTGTMGKDPGWDPLQFLLDEAHALGMEVHAWFNVYKVRGPGKVSSPLHPARTLGAAVVNVDGEGWLDPGIPEVREYLVKVAVDLVRNYRIDGIQFDYIRYPGREFPDDGVYRRYGKGMEKADWRRANITQFVRAFHDSASRIRPAMKVGSAPLGVFTVGNGKNGWGAFHVYYQDSQRWLREGIHDYLAPQIYWDIGETPADPDFERLAYSWRENASGRHIYVGMAPYKPRVLKELPRQIDVARAAGTAGQAFFRYEHIQSLDMFDGRYDEQATIPPMPWKDGIPPNPPGPVAVSEISPTVFHVEWSPPLPASDGDVADYYNVYRSTSSSGAIHDMGMLVATTRQTVHIDTIKHHHGVKYYYAVTALDKLRNESAPSEVSPVLVKEALEVTGRLDATPLLATLPGSPPLLAYKLPQRMMVHVELVNTADQMPATSLTIASGEQDGGTYVVGVDTERVLPGSYTVRLHAGGVVIEQHLKVR